MSDDFKPIKPSILPGFMELLPEEQILFNQMKNTIEKIYQESGFAPIQTPLIEKEEILLAKAGGETEKQIYRVESDSKNMMLRFDLTVPLARYVAQYFPSLQFPFRRYQIEKVFRGERNQRGRYREFYQSDIDIIGHNELSPLYDAEIPSIIYRIFSALGFSDFKIHMNNRKLLNGFFEAIGIQDKVSVLQTLDKIDKIGWPATEKMLQDQGLSQSQIEQVYTLTQISGTQEEVLGRLSALDYENETWLTGLSELKGLHETIQDFQVPLTHYQLDLKITRGLDYYTGTVYETFLTGYESLGSVCSGGRYDNLAGFYTKEKLPGVGISIGLTRLFFQLNEMGFFKDRFKRYSNVLILPMDASQIQGAIQLTAALREAHISSEVFLDEAKFKKKLNYANKLNIPYVIILGEEEIKTQIYTLKNMEEGTQESLSLTALINFLRIHI